MRLLEVFCGTKSFGKVFEKHNWEVISLDNDAQWSPTILANVLDWDFKNFDKNYFNHIHFSPPCIMMSQLQQSWYGRYKGRGENKYLWTEEIHLKELEKSDLILHKINEIINYFENITFTIENPYHKKSNSIIKRNILNYPFEIVDYCRYNHPIKKPTTIFNNFNLKLLRCNKYKDNEHKHISYKKYCPGGDGLKNKVFMIPEELIEEIFKQRNEYLM
jgi:hypothetical protein